MAIDRTTDRPVAPAAIFRTGLVAAVTGAVINVVIALAARALFDIPDDFAPLEPRAVALSTFVAMLLGTGVYVLLASRTASRDRLFTILAFGFALVALLPLMSPAVGTRTTAAVLVIVVLHLVPAAIIVGMLTRRRA